MLLKKINRSQFFKISPIHQLRKIAYANVKYNLLLYFAV